MDEEDGAPRARKASSMLMKQPGDKRVSMHSTELKRALISLFQKSAEHKLQTLVDTLDHPVQPLKAMLKELADYDKRDRVYRLKEHLRFR